MPNAANTATVATMLRAAAPDGVEVVDRHADLAVLAVQGPRRRRCWSRCCPTAAGLAGWADMAFADVAGIRVCRTGYTGEHGYELLVPAEEAPEVWDALLAAAGPLDGRPCGLAARDTLRTEMGYALHGQDLSPEITPVQAGSGWAVGWTKPEFWGRAALLAEKEAGPGAAGCAACGRRAAACPGRGWRCSTRRGSGSARRRRGRSPRR